MAIIGIVTNKENPEYTSADFLFWMPQYKAYLNTPAGVTAFNNLYELANNKIFHSIFGSDWKLAMSYCIAHYLTLIGFNEVVPSGSSLAEIAGGTVTNGVLASASVGEWNKTFDLSKTMLDSQESLFWNQTKWGSLLMTLLKTKAIPSILVVTSYPVPGAN